MTRCSLQSIGMLSVVSILLGASPDSTSITQKHEVTLYQIVEDSTSDVSRDQWISYIPSKYKVENMPIIRVSKKSSKHVPKVVRPYRSYSIHKKSGVDDLPTTNDANIADNKPVSQVANDVLSEMKAIDSDSLDWRIYGGIRGFTAVPKRKISGNLQQGFGYDFENDEPNALMLAGILKIGLTNNMGASVGLLGGGVLNEKSPKVLANHSLNQGAFDFAMWYRFVHGIKSATLLKVNMTSAWGDSLHFSGDFDLTEQKTYGFYVAHDRLFQHDQYGSVGISYFQNPEGVYGLEHEPEGIENPTTFIGNRGSQTNISMQYVWTSKLQPRLLTVIPMLTKGVELTFDNYEEGDVPEDLNTKFSAPNMNSLTLIPKIGMVFPVRAGLNLLIAYEIGLKIPLIENELGTPPMFYASFNIDGEGLNIMKYLLKVNAPDEEDRKRNRGL